MSLAAFTMFRVVFEAGQGIPADDRAVGQAGQQVGVEITGYFVLATVASKVGEVDGGALVRWIDSLGAGVAGVGGGEEAVGRKQCADVELDDQVIEMRFTDVSATVQEVVKPTCFGVLAGDS